MYHCQILLQCAVVMMFGVVRLNILWLAYIFLWNYFGM
jgi:hypothetical protein